MPQNANTNGERTEPVKRKLPKILHHYKSADFALQQKVRFVFLLCLIVILFMFPIILSSIYRQLNSATDFNIPLILSQVFLTLFLAFCLLILIKGYFQLAANLVLISTFICVWFVLFIDYGDVLVRLDTVVFVLAVLSMTPLFVTRNRYMILVYTFLNLVILIVFTMLSAKSLHLSGTEIIDYLADTGISLVFIGLLAYNIFKINERSLEKATMDILERKKAEEALAQSEKKFREMADLLPQTIFECDLNGKLTYVNKNAYDLFGYNEKEFLQGINVLSTISKPDREKAQVNISLVLKGEKLKGPKYNAVKKNGDTFPIQVFSNPILENNMPIGLRGIIIDYTQQYEIEEKLRQSARKYLIALETLPLGCLLSDISGKVYFINQAFKDTFGYTLNEIKDAESWFNLAYPDQEYRKFVKTEWEKDNYRLINQTEDRIPQIYQVTTKSGDVKTIEFKQSFFEGELLVLFYDISYRKQTEDALKQSEELFKNLIEFAPYPMVVNDMQGRYIIVNDSFIKESGFSAQEVIGKTAGEFGIHLDEKTGEYIRSELAAKGKVENLETVFMAKNGVEIDAIYSSRIIQLKDQQVILSSTINITEKKNIERELLKYRNHLESLVKERTEELNLNIEELQLTRVSLEKRNKELHGLQMELLKEKRLIDSLMDTIPDAIYFKDLDSRFLKVSKSMYQNLFKKHQSEVIGKTDYDFFTEEHAKPAYEMEQKIILSGEPIIDIVEKETWKDGHITYASTTKMPLRDAAGNIIGTFGVSRDITRLKEMEDAIRLQNMELRSKSKQLEQALNNLKKTQNQLIHSEKMASLGVLAAGIAHEINNPLNFISGGITGIETYLNEKFPEPVPELNFLIQSIQTGVSRAGNIVSGLSQYSRRDDIPPVKCDIHSIIENCLLMLQNELKNRIIIEKKFSAKKYKLIANEGKLHQVILNILSNSAHAIEKEGIIKIQTDIEENKMKIVVEDNGCGIKQENLPKILDPFFTTKEPGKGTGLGLSITYNIIQEHNGIIEFDSSPGNGTVVTIKLPLEKK